MAMVISGRAKAVITALVAFFLLGVVLVTGSTKGWFISQRYHGERVAARIQVGYHHYLTLSKSHLHTHDITVNRHQTQFR